MTLIPWKEGKCLLWDVTCVDTLSKSHLPKTAANARSAATEAENKKRIKYSHLEDQFLFTPVGFETLGPWGPEALRLISKIGSLVANQSGETRSTSFLKQRISLTIQRGNAASILSSLPSHRSLDEVFLLPPYKLYFIACGINEIFKPRKTTHSTRKLMAELFLYIIGK